MALAGPDKVKKLHCISSRLGTSRRSICPISAVRFVSARVNSCIASFAVLRFEPAATMPASTAVTATPITAGSNWIAAINIAMRTAQPRNGDPAGQDIFAAAFNSGGELIDLRLKLHNLVVMVGVVHGASL